DVGQTETWSIATAPVHGTLGGFTTTGTSTGGTITPSTLSYTPVPGFGGADMFTVQVSDGVAVATTTVTVMVNPLPSPITGITSFCQGSVTTLSDGIAGGTWISDNLPVATIDPVSGIVSGV